MIKLQNDTLATLPEHVRRPNYDHSTLTPKVAHIGVGNFHHEHRARYLHRPMQRRFAQNRAITGTAGRPYDIEHDTSNPEKLKTASRVNDCAPVPLENSRQWDIEDNFCARRPERDEAGTTVTVNLHQFEPNGPVWEQLTKPAHEARKAPLHWLEQRQAYGDIADEPRLSAAFEKWPTGIYRDGLEAAIRRFVEGT